jgi:5-oxoprolinase (ATP-hydrolysing)
MRTLGANLKRGDVILANHPKAGGSHLPDLTVITPVFHEGAAQPVFFVANRGHHADIGGISPGSMPPHSNFLWQEGASFKSFYLVRGGEFQVVCCASELIVWYWYRYRQLPSGGDSSGSCHPADPIFEQRQLIKENQIFV